MKRLLAIFACWLLVGCAAPTPVPPSLPPSVDPSLVPSIEASAAPTLIPAAPIPDPLIPDPALLPTLDKTIDLGTRGKTDDWQLVHPIALDERHQRLYVSTSFSKTVVLDVETLTQIGEIQAGGSVAVLPESDKLYIGVPGAFYYDNSAPNVYAELRVYDASTLAFRRSAVFSDTSVMPPIAVPDAPTGRVYIVHQGVYIANADSLEITGNLSGTLLAPGMYAYSPYAIDAAIDPARQRLFVSLNNGVPGSNNGNFLYVYDLTNGQLINHDYERSTLSLAVDTAAGTAFAPRSYMSGAALVKYDAQGAPLRRLDGAAGLVRLDPISGRVYVLNSYPNRFVVLDNDLNYSGEIAVEPLADVLDFAIDAARDRLLVLTPGGQLHVLRGHGRAMRDQPPLPEPSRGAVQWIATSPDFEHDRTVMAAFSGDEYGSGPGTLFVNRDDGKTWQLIAGLPMTNTATALAFSPDYANDQTLWVGLASYFNGSGIYRSTDGGRTWQPTSRGLTDLAISRLVVSPDFKADHTLFAAGTRGGLYRSTDGGDKWVSLADRYRTDPNALAMLSTVAVSPNFARDGRLLIGYMSGQGGTWLSRDRGETWTKVLAESVSRVAYLADGQTVYAVLSSNSVARSDDGGEHWVAASAGLDLPSGGLLDLVAGTDYALAWLTVYDQPTHLFYRPVKDLPWHEVGSADQPFGNVFALAGDGSLFTGDSHGVLHRYYVDNLADKIPPSRRVSDLKIQSIVIAKTGAGNETIISGGSFGVWASFDLINWFDTQFPDRHSANVPQIVASPAYDQDATLFATLGNNLYRSRGKPWRWEPITIETGGDIPIGSLAISPQFAVDHTLLVAGDYRVPRLFASRDGGDSWTPIAPPIPITQSQSMRVAIGPDDVWWTWIDYVGLYRSPDHGQTWSEAIDRSVGLSQWMVSLPETSQAGQTWPVPPIDPPINLTMANTIVFSPDYARDYTIFVGTNGGLFRSTDAGARWARIDVGLPTSTTEQQVITAVAISPSFATDHTVLVATYDGGLAISRDRGYTWSVVDQ